MSHKAITFDQLAVIGKSPAHYKWSLDNEVSQRDVIEHGVYVKVFAPDSFDKKFITSSIKPDYAAIGIVESGEYSVFLGKVRRGKAWEEFKANNENIITQKQLDDARAFIETKGKVIISERQEAEIERLASACNKNPAIVDMRYKDSDETIYTFERMGVLLEFSVDIIINGKPYLFNIVKNASQNSVETRMKRDQFHRRAAFIKDGLNAFGIETKTVGVIVVDDDYPAMSTVFHSLSSASMLFGGSYSDYLRTLAKCRESGEWDGYPQEYDQLVLKSY